MSGGPPRRSPRVRMAVGAVVVLALVGVAAAVVGSLVTPGGATSIIGAAGDPAIGAGPDGAPGGAGPGGAGSAAALDGDAALDPLAAPTAAAVVVHVLGAVRRPGIVEVRLGDRVIDAIAAAGGTTDDADLAGVNLARALVDGEQVFVPRVGEAPPGGVVGGAGAAPSASGHGAGLVDINTADASALETLTGVGPALAERIIAWRETNGPFRSVDELLAVSGIGEKTLAGFRDEVTV